MTTPTTGFDARQPRLPDPRDAVAHLAPETWERANRLLVRKALAEFAHERLITPEPGPDGLFSVTSDDGGVEYRFAARVMALEHWRIEADSIVRRDLRRDGAHLPLDALDLILDLRKTLTLDEDVLPVYLEEITSTLASSTYRMSGARPGAAELARAGFQEIEAGMTEGHPCFVANNGRLGFDAAEYRAYAPDRKSVV